MQVTKSHKLASRSRRLLVALLSRARTLVACVSVDEHGAAKADDETQAAAARQWSDLPDDLLGMVYVMAGTGPLERVRLAGVCRSWRAVVTSQQHLALPWLLFLPPCGDKNKTSLLYRPEDGGVLRVPLPRVTIGRWIVGSGDGGWVAAFEFHRCLLAVVNLFSGAKVALPKKQARPVCACSSNHYYPLSIVKLVFSEAPTSSGCIIAAITPTRGVALCRAGRPDGRWSTEQCDQEPLADIAFCNGELYGLTFYGEVLIRYEIDVNDDDGAPVVTAAHRLAIQTCAGAGRPDEHPLEHVSHIVELHGKPAMAVRTRWSHRHEPCFRVFELADADADAGGAYVYKWAEVTSLGDYALFLGPMTATSRAVHVPAGGRGGVEANRVYYSNSRGFRSDELLGGDVVCFDQDGGTAFYSGDQGVGGDDGVEKSITSLGYYGRGNRLHTGLWLLPPHL